MPRTPAPVWKHFAAEACKQKAKCIHCEQIYSCKGGTTTCLLNHLKSNHEEEYKKIQDNGKSKRFGDTLKSEAKQVRLDTMF